MLKRKYGRKKIWRRNIRWTISMVSKVAAVKLSWKRKNFCKGFENSRLAVVNCHVNGTTLERGLIFQTGLNSLRVLCKLDLRSLPLFKSIAFNKKCNCSLCAFLLLLPRKFYIRNEMRTIKCMFWNTNDSIVKLLLSQAQFLCDTALVINIR